MKRKIVYEDVINEFKERNYTLLEEEYKNAHQKMKYICNEHPNVIQTIQYLNFSKGHGCRICGRNLPIKTIDEVNNILKKIKPNIICINYAGNMQKKSVFRCLFDGYEWSTTFYYVKTSKNTNCPKCISHIRIEDIRDINNYLNQNKNSIICTYYAGNTFSADSVFKCKVCGDERKTSFSNIKNTKGCVACSKLKRITNIDEVNNQLKEINKNIICIDYCGNVMGKSKFKCLLDENEWFSTYNNIKKGNGCPKCSASSKGELKIETFLKENHIDFIPQYRIDECKDKSTLPFDFSIFINNKMILCEYQGIQHYEPIKFAGKKDTQANERLKYTRKHDDIKRDYCLKNNIELIIIPYWEYDNVENILGDKLRIYQEGCA